ncbi:hypothetical protein [Eshraghiella crossota]|uniref:hypothetical protein n=1 Tax=Eshraghiella crossota TaxID=45851 RepID=UPI004029C4C0
MANAGRVAIVPKGDWDSSEAYKRLDAVTYNNILYIAKKVVPKNTAVTNTDYWMPSVAGGVAVKATTTNIGQVQPDGETIEVDADGKISAKTALDTKPTIIATAEPNIVDTVESPMLVTNATRNLLNPTLESTTKNGVTITKNGDGTYTLNGTNTTTSETAGTTWINIASVTLPNQKAVLLGSNNPKVGVYITGETSTVYGDKSGEIIESDYGKTTTFGIAIAYKATLDNVVVKPMITTDISATYDDFVPYDGYEIKSCGKNLLDPNAAGTYDSPHTESGITFTKNNDGSWTINGTATADVGMSVGNSGGDHTFIELEADAKAFLFGSSGVSGLAYGFYTNESKQISNIENIPKGTKIRNLWISCYKGNTFNNVKVLGVISYDLNLTNEMYVPYQESTVHIDPTTQFPLLGLKSFDGETNIISPANVEVTFAKNDSGKAILGMCKPTVKNLVSTVEGNPLDATMGAQLKKEIDELKAKVDAMSTSTTTE